MVDSEQTTGENPLVALTAFRLFLHNFVSLHPSVDITVIALCSRSPQRVTMAPTDGTLPRSCPLIGGERVLSGEQLVRDDISPGWYLAFALSFSGLSG